MNPPKTAIRLFLSRFLWLRGQPPRNGSFLVQTPNGKVYFEWRMLNAPGNREILYWKRCNAKLKPPKEYLSYHAKNRLDEGEDVPFVRDFY